MYKLTKSKGCSENLVLTNLGTSATQMLGRVTTHILNLLKSSGCELPTHTDDTIDIYSEWTLTISKEVAIKLQETLRRGIKKPIRKPATKREQTFDIKQTTNSNDLFDLIFGEV